ncbi:hypothetical protein V5O48_013554 [Marasmius crinis-equi]|uniref:Cytochrome P450 n=1 Tax=Marasmius crinis-equi TaxID=585013 RepID=A0ABR3EZV3_9AGAR
MDGRGSVKRASMRYGDRLFTFAEMGYWFVLAKARAHVRDICNAPEDILSMEAAAEELLQLRHTVGPLFCDETYHIPAIRASLNLNLANVLPSLIDEVDCCFKEFIDSRLKPGKGRNIKYLEIVSRFPSQIFLVGPIIKMLVPKFLKRFTGSVFRTVYGHHRRLLKLVRPVIEETRDRRKRQLEAPTGSENMIDWLMNAAPDGNEQSAESLAMRLLNVNFVALHTTTKIFIHALYNLAANPCYIPILRDELQANIGRRDPTRWSTQALARCAKLDSFLRETLRFNVLASISMSRVALRDFRFSDGTTIPAGYFVAVASDVAQHNEAVYPSPQEFRPFRFVTDDPGSVNDWQNKMTCASESFLAFGGGRHVCPGRFFAATELKIFMAYLVLNYDVKMTCEGVRPADKWLGIMASPSSTARIMIRKRP